VFTRLGWACNYLKRKVFGSKEQVLSGIPGFWVVIKKDTGIICRVCPLYKEGLFKATV
jgi:acyl-ACP thioesterase